MMQKDNIKSRILRYLMFFVLAWLFVHLFAFLGLFVVLAYTVLWFIIPKKLPCFLLCTDTTVKKRKLISVKKHYSKDLRSMVFNSFFLFVVTLLSAAIVVLEARILFNVDLFNKHDSIEFSIPPRQQYKMGEIFPLKILIENITEPINAVQVDIGYDPSSIEIVSISEKDSFATIFIEKSIDNEKGFARFSGGLPNPGYSGEQGLFGTMYLKGKKAGLTEVEFLPTSLVLANDGKGSNIAGKIDKAAFFILPEYLSNEELKEQGAVLTPAVLGIEDDKSGNKLYLYDRSNVLGAETSISENQPESEFVKVLTIPFDVFFEGLKIYDSFVLRFLKDLISVFYV